MNSASNEKKTAMRSRISRLHSRFVAHQATKMELWEDKIKMAEARIPSCRSVPASKLLVSKQHEPRPAGRAEHFGPRYFETRYFDLGYFDSGYSDLGHFGSRSITLGGGLSVRTAYHVSTYNVLRPFVCTYTRKHVCTDKGVLLPFWCSWSYLQISSRRSMSPFEKGG